MSSRSGRRGVYPGTVAWIEDRPPSVGRTPGSLLTPRWREMDSNPRSPVRRTTLFETPLSQHARHRRLRKRSPPVQQLLLPVVDPVRMNSELTRQLGDRPVPRPPPPPPLRF